MGIVYILTLIVLGIAFMAMKKSKEKVNFIKWLIIFFVTLYGYNVTIGMVLGLINIASHIWLLSIINLVVAYFMGFKAIKNKDMQKYYVRKEDIIIVVIAFVLFVVMFIKDCYIYKGNVAHFAVDSAVHYRAAKHYSDNLKIFVMLEDKSFFNFNIMQTGAYINDGIFMNVVHSFTNIDYAYLYQMFETLTMYATGLAFLAIFMDKITTKRGIVFSMMLFCLYMYGYPFNSWFYGFSYLSVGLTMILALAVVTDLMFAKENYKRWFIVILIGLLGMGLIFSYCLFVPPVFAAICLYIWMKEYKEEGKAFLKFFKKYGLIVFGVLMAVTIFGIGYLFIPSFFVRGQTNLVSALQIDGAIYSGKWVDIYYYIPFAILYAIDLVIKFRKKELSYFDVFAVVFMGFFMLILIGNRFGRVSKYYMFKVFYALWGVMLGVSVEEVNRFINTKVLKIIIPIYVTVWFLFVAGWVEIKAGHILGEEEKHALPNYVGMYYMENAEYRKLVDLTQDFMKGQLEVTRYAREHLEDMTVENTLLVSENYYDRMWAVATLEFSSDTIPYEKVTQDTNIYSAQDGFDDEEKIYIVNVREKDHIDELEKEGKIKVLFENDTGYVAEIVR